MADAHLANKRLPELFAEREKLIENTPPSDESPQIDVATTLSYRRRLDKVLAHGTPGERKKFIRKWVKEIKLTPERLEVEVTYRAPELFVNNLVAGAGFKPATFGL